MKKYIKLFFATLYISAFTFGGGYVIVSLMKKKFSDELEWIDGEEMLNLVAIAQSSPGAVAVNASLLVGKKIAGWAGAAVAVLATVIPPFVIISIISYFYQAFSTNIYVAYALRGMQAGVCAVIIDVVINLTRNIVVEKKPLPIFMIALAFCATYFLKINLIYIILVCGTIGGVQSILEGRKTSKAKAHAEAIEDMEDFDGAEFVGTHDEEMMEEIMESVEEEDKEL